METPSEQLQGSVERVTFHNSENGYTVVRVQVRDNTEPVTVVGHLASVQAGEFVEALGEWADHREFGRQFKAHTLRTIHPSSLDGIEKYLGSGLIKGIGPRFASRLVKRFGLEVFEVIEHSPQKLRSVPGIGSGRQATITRAWKEQKAVRDIMVFLQSHGVSTAKSVRIYKTYGDNAISVLKQDPYQLARDIHGIGFKNADRIAGNMGIDKQSLIRARAGILHVLHEKVGGGHCAYPVSLLLKEASALLEIPDDILQSALGSEFLSGAMVRREIDGTACAYPSYLDSHEEDVAQRVAALSRGKPPWKEIRPEAIEAAQLRVGIRLDPLQREAIATALRSKITVITGGPGTGKTTLTRVFLSILAEQRVPVELCSPTGRAAKRLSELTGREARTIHRLLGSNRKSRGFAKDENDPLDLDCLLVDEASMIDLPLLHSLLKAVPPHAAILFIGDVDQIPSVGPGEVLAGLIESQAIATVRLTHIFRQAIQSAIIINAHRINGGEFPDLTSKPKESDFHFLEATGPQEIISKVIELVRTRIPKHLGIDATKDIQVLVPMNLGPLGTRAFNLELQKALNPLPLSQVERFGTTFAVGDKVMVTVNDYDKEVFNGDIGFITAIDLEEQRLSVVIDDRQISFEFSELDTLTLAYATTIHKAQGSEYPAVVLVLGTQHYVMLRKNLLYTAVTRGKRLVVIVGHKTAIAMALQSPNQGKRWHHLDDRIRKQALQLD